MSDSAPETAEKLDLPTTARGKRPQVFSDAAQDHLLAMILELASDLWVVTDKLAAQEAYLRREIGMTDEALKALAAAPEHQAEQTSRRQAFLARLMRTLESEI